MTAFVHLEYSNQHPGVVRAESAIGAVVSSAQHLKHKLSGTRSLAMLLLSAMVAAVMVVANQVMDTVAEGHLLALWVGMWLVAFAALATFAGTATQLALTIKGLLDSWSLKVAAKRADERLWAMAKADVRVMADLQHAISRNPTASGSYDDSLGFVAPVQKAVTVQSKSSRLTRTSLRAYQRLYI